MIGTDSLPSSPDGGRDGATYHPALLSVAVALVLIVELVWPRIVNVSWQVVALFALLAFVVRYRDLGGIDLPAVGNGLGDDIRSVRNELDAAIEVTTRQARALSDGASGLDLDPGAVYDLHRLDDPADDAFIGTFSRDDGGVAALRGSRDSTISADATDVDSGEYEFELAVPDTGKTTEASLSVQTF